MLNPILHFKQENFRWREAEQNWKPLKQCLTQFRRGDPSGKNKKPVQLSKHATPQIGSNFKPTMLATHILELALNGELKDQNVVGDDALDFVHSDILRIGFGLCVIDPLLHDLEC